MRTEDEENQKRLRSSAFRGDAGEVERLLAAGVNPDAPDEEGNTSLIEGVQALNLEAVRLLLDAGANPEIGDNEESATPLVWAVRSTYQEGDWDYSRALAIVSLLLEKGAEVNARTESGATALIYAVSADQTRIVEVLLKGGADPNIPTNAGWSALDYANEYRMIGTETKDLLVAAGARSKRQRRN